MLFAVVVPREQPRLVSVFTTPIAMGVGKFITEYKAGFLQSKVVLNMSPQDDPSLTQHRRGAHYSGTTVFGTCSALPEKAKAFFFHKVQLLHFSYVLDFYKTPRYYLPLFWSRVHAICQLLPLATANHMKSVMI